MRTNGHRKPPIPRVDDWLEAMQPASPALLTASELAARWHMSARSFERWRRKGAGPPWVRLEGRVLYRLSDVLAYEAARLEGPEL